MDKPPYYDPTQPGLPVYEMIINTEENSDIEVSYMALVDKPAIEKNFLAFKTDRLHFTADLEKRIISGPAMVAGSLIYRKDENGEYNVFFSKETIREIALKFFKKDYQKNINLFHDPKMQVDGVTIFESFVSDQERGVMPMRGFEDLPDGSWFISAKIDNEDVWSKIKNGEVKGFSVEGIFSYVRKLSGKPSQYSHLEEKTLMSELKDLWENFKEKFIGDVNPPVTQKLNTDYQLKDGTPISIDKLEAGGVVTLNGSPAPAGSYELADGMIVTVGEGGVITEVMAAAQPAQPAAPDYAKQFSSIDEKFAAYEQRFTEQAGNFTKLNEAFTKQSETLASLVAIVGKIVETPTADPVDEGHKKFQTHKQDSKEEKRKEFVELFKKLKNK